MDPMHRLIITVVCLCAVGCGESYRPEQRDAPASSTPSVSEDGSRSAATADAATGGVLEIDGLRLTAPDAWVRQEPRSEFVTAEFSLPRAEGDETDGRLTVSKAGGGVDANLERWRGQFEGNLTRDVAEDLQVAGLTVKLLDCAGTFNDQPGPFAPGVQREGYRMIGAVIPTEGQLTFVKAYGPEKTMEKYEQSIRSFLQNLELN
jgi:hypothetical protein